MQSKNVTDKMAIAYIAMRNAQWEIFIGLPGKERISASDMPEIEFSQSDKFLMINRMIID